MTPPTELADHACWPSRSRGRRFVESDDGGGRHIHQRDRDRIVHSAAFRRLVYKTQVFVNHEGDLFRTRLTHSLEVAQVARSMARALRLNEDLVEAICLAHDLGHTPFGHAGQEALHACMKDHGGFEHNVQSLRVVDELEESYPAFNGLNLSFETREGILKHCNRAQAQALVEREGMGGLGQRFLDGGQPSLEAQLCDVADALAYNAHDVDDGVRSGLLSMEQVASMPMIADHLEAVRLDHPELHGRRVLLTAIRRMVNEQINDVIRHSAEQIAMAQPGHPDAVRDRREPLITWSKPMRSQALSLKRALFAQLYRHPQVAQTAVRAQCVVRTLFEHYQVQPETMGADFAQRDDRWRAVADYVSGMTDRHAVREFERWTGENAFPAHAVNHGSRLAQGQSLNISVS